MAKKRVSKKTKVRLATYGIISIILIGYFVVTAITYTYRIISLKNEQEMLQNELAKLDDEQNQLKHEITKLKDPTYLANYARENYQYSRDGELIIQIHEEEKEEEAEETKNLWPYIVISSSGGLLVLLLMRRK